MYDYVNYYEEYEGTFEENVKKASANVSKHSVSDYICPQLEDAIENLNSLKKSLSTETVDSVVNSFINNVNIYVETITPIQEFLTIDYKGVEGVYKDLQNDLETLKAKTEELKTEVNELKKAEEYLGYLERKRNAASQEKKSEVTNLIIGSKKKVTNLREKVKEIKEICTSLKCLIESYKSYLKQIAECDVKLGATGKKVPSREPLLSVLDTYDNVSNISIYKEKLDVPSQEIPKLDDYLTYTYQTNVGPTTVYYKVVPAKYFQPQLSFSLNSNGKPKFELPWNRAKKVGAAIATNFSVFDGGRTGEKKGETRDGGEGILYDGDQLYIGKHYNCDTTLYMDKDGNLGYINNSIFKSKSDVKPYLEDKNIQWAAKSFYPIIDNYEYVNNNTDPNIGGNNRHPRTFFGQLDNGDYIIGVCSGRNTNDEGVYEHGMTVKEVGDFILNYATDEYGNKINVRFLMNGDGGGSAAFVTDGEKKNVSGTDRPTPDILCFGGAKV